MAMAVKNAFPLDELPAELSAIVLEHLSYGALARLALTNRVWAARVAPTVIEVLKQHAALVIRVGEATTFDELEAAETWVQNHPRMQSYNPFGGGEPFASDFRAPHAATYISGGVREPAFSRKTRHGAQDSWYTYRDASRMEYQELKDLDDRQQLLAAAKYYLKDSLRFLKEYGPPDEYQKLFNATVLRLSPEEFLILGGKMLKEATALPGERFFVEGEGRSFFPLGEWKSHSLPAAASLLRRAEWTPAQLIKLGELSFDLEEYSELIEGSWMKHEFKDKLRPGVIDEFENLLQPRALADSQNFWFHIFSKTEVDNDCVNFVPPDDGTPEPELVSHATTLNFAALTSLLKVAVDEVETYAENDEFEEDPQEGYDFVGKLLIEWARRVQFPAGCLDRADLNDLIAMIAAQPEWLKKRLARESLVWIDELISADQHDRAQSVCRALRATE